MTKSEAIKLCVDGGKITHNEMEGYIYYGVDGLFYRNYPPGNVHLYSFNEISFTAGFKTWESSQNGG